MSKGWIGVDLDGTLAVYTGWKGPEHIGEPIRPMVGRIKAWLEEGREVRIFTARAYMDLEHTNRSYIQDWLVRLGLPRLSVTCVKDFEMLELWDDRAVQVVPNTGRRADGR